MSLPQCVRQLEDLVENQGFEVALLAEVESQPAGTCLLVREEIESMHDVTPWLAGLYVLPKFRKRGVGRRLVSAIEEHARVVQCRRIYLYTPNAETYYARLGWSVIDRFDWTGDAFVLMHREV